MHKFLQPQSVMVRYGTTIATFGRVTSNIILANTEPVYAGFALASNIVGLSASHTKPGVTAEAALAFSALTAMGASGVEQENPMMMWMAGVGMFAFGTAFARNVRYTKMCPKKWRRYEDQEKAPAPQTVQPDFSNNMHDLTKRKMFIPGMIALAGVTPFIIDGVIRGMHGDPNGWNRALGGAVIFASNLVSSVSIPQKQKHWLKALRETAQSMFFPEKKEHHHKDDVSSGPHI